MSTPLNERFDNRDIELSNFARSIGHPIRLMILRKMAESKDGQNADMIATFPLAPSTVLQHLRDLKKAGLIKGKIFGSNAHFYLNQERLGELNIQLSEFSEMISGSGNFGSKT